MPLRTTFLTAAVTATVALVPAVATAPLAGAATKKKTGCAALKTKKQQTACKKGRKTTKLRRGQVCSLGKAKGAEYKRLGYFCLDISAGQDGSLTYLEELGR
ncbi:hypothetical protein GKE82_11080 [Conexibacter sp. W3-3-2]|uniref:Uncharacterized protein n=1 Tax=Paraconexibacter algicola TaxID=2133960 RepID=A0A2T4UH63_9ACTN|nr:MULTISPECIES: hypothetical protein [Solirubrobacterales]MTD44818.1 hypothetical protein [Conexibacter sp. W3-3-2]PTL58558.1 hypothetical protein C7Y72_02235 [Paraconexibacter algicola]